MNTCGRLGINFGQALVQGGPALGSRFLLQLASDFRVGARHVGYSLQQRLEVHHGAANQQGGFPGCDNVAYRGFGVVAKLCHGIHLGGIANIYQPVGVIRFGAANIQPSIHQRGIHTDQLTGLLLGQTDGKIGFAGGGGAQQANQEGLFHLTSPQEQLIQFVQGQLAPGGATVITLASALGGLHIPQQRIHFGNSEAPIGAH